MINIKTFLFATVSVVAVVLSISKIKIGPCSPEMEDKINDC